MGRAPGELPPGDSRRAVLEVRVRDVHRGGSLGGTNTQGRHRPRPLHSHHPHLMRILGAPLERDRHDAVGSRDGMPTGADGVANGHGAVR
jgi:hypothetical protein